MIMDIDPNWLYSTIAQSSAAIVAIIGGFITASVLMLNSEKRSLKNQLSSKKARLKELEELEKNAEPGLFGVELPKEKSVLTGEIADIKSRLKSFSYPPNLGWGLFVLLILAVFGIITPLLVIFTQSFTNTNSLIVMISFIVSLFAMFLYIAMQIGTLRRR